jgi:hypothetical protein
MKYKQFLSMTPEQIEEVVESSKSPISLRMLIVQYTGRMADEACAGFKRALGYVRKVAKRVASCLWRTGLVFTAGIVTEPTSADLQGFRTVLPDWSEYPDRNYQYRCERMRGQIEQEIAMEELHRDALELLVK